MVLGCTVKSHLGWLRMQALAPPVFRTLRACDYGTRSLLMRCLESDRGFRATRHNAADVEARRRGLDVEGLRRFGRWQGLLGWAAGVYTCSSLCVRICVRTAHRMPTMQWSDVEPRSLQVQPAQPTTHKLNWATSSAWFASLLLRVRSSVGLSSSGITECTK